MVIYTPTYAWGSLINDQRGIQITRVLDNEVTTGDIVTLNDGFPSLIILYGQKLAVDLTFCTADVAGTALWNTISDNLGSDHF